ncbi:acetyltransferase [Pontibacillus yanchengensis Y32]|uniref:Acetyltransferase n=2 Tax=Pontibacillus yanchengensis TaxID=462910 RepID=A0A0A2TSY9_9BACI|nr:acetyltransferase [Pontibacillus yanchengensis Y32]
MIKVKRATEEHVEGISRVCSVACYATYEGIRSYENIKRNNERFYNHKRITDELEESNGWDGYIVALDEEEVVGAIGGGMTGENKSEIYVLYLHPTRRGEGIGSQLLQYLTDIQKNKGSTEQWVSVQKGNKKGIPFYQTKGFTSHSERMAYSNSSEEDYVSIRYVRTI